MKSIVPQFLLLLYTILAVGQTPTLDLSKEYLFTNGNLSNTASTGITYDISIGSQYTLSTVNDPLNSPNNAITINGETFNGNTHPSNQGNYTLSFWLKTTDAQGGQIMEQRGNSSSFAGYVMFLDAAGALNILGVFKYVNTYSSPAITTTNVSVNDGNWHHIAITAELVARTTTSGQILNKQVYTIYVDGVLSAQSQTNEIFVGTPVEIFNNGAALKFNPQNNSGQANAIYTGDLDNYREYTRLLTPVEIGQLYNEFANTSNVTYIDKDATGNNDGTSWQDAFTDITSTLENAQDNSEIWIKGGEYIPNATGNGALGINITATGLKIYGSFAGNETQISERVFGSNQTIISGDVNGNDTGTPSFTQNTSTTSDNIGTLMRISEFSNSEKTVLDGIIFTRAFQDNGAGALLFSGDNYPNITITNCSFTLNLQDTGAAIYSNYLVGFVSQSSTGLGIEINQCIFDNNVARIGAGISLANQDDNFTRFVTADITISNSLFSNNTVTDNSLMGQGVFGSAMRIFQQDSQSLFTIDITNNTFAKNKELGTILPASERYVVVLESPLASYQTVSVTNNIFWDNTTSGNAVASSIGGGSGFTSNITLVNCLGEDNFSNIPMAQQTNSLNSSPLFVNVANNDFTLQNTSSAIDAGNNSLVIGVVDLNNNNRIVSNTVDIGAYEFDTNLSTTQFNNDLSLKIYPNPVSDILQVKSNIAIQKIEVYSMFGEKVMSIKETATINLSNLKSGIYFLKIYGSNQLESTKRFIKN
ncbi:T9SS type A sorting domain-containing protein [Kordia sp. YSTF-M3]|uniref:T9SS type A sorting domain-containing protein n=1 Tax=Kordia aestuariivivens TaxID=2759037 RepID=A0ABR7Q5U3_9FLAO|nr:T9SS type A sorting domain-containing protein [Kordia aestuariivivens]MBC8753915.1 T9SS type A sorting domain-containing protein [Kordia aestuariivivens]